MKKLLENTLNQRKEKIDKNISKFTKEEIKEFELKYDEILNEGFKEYIEFKHKYEFQKEENLLEFMRNYKEPIIAWVKNFSLKFKLLSFIFSNFVIELDKEIDNTSYLVIFDSINIVSCKCINVFYLA
jgi:hypothetical protein